MKRLLSIFLALSIFISGCAAEKSETPENPMGKVIIEDNGESEFVRQHLNYINSNAYQNDIIPSFPKNMQPTITEIWDDEKLWNYNGWTVLEDLLAADFEGAGAKIKFDADQQYAFLFSEILYANEGKYLQNEFLDSFQESAVEVSNAVLNSLDTLSSMSDSMYSKPEVDKISGLIDKIDDLDPNSYEYINCFEEITDQLDILAAEGSFEAIGTKIIENTFESINDKVFIAKVVTAILDSTSQDVLSFINKLRLAKAFLNTSDYMERVIGEISLFAALHASSDKVYTAPYGWLQNVARDFYNQIEAYKYDKTIELLADVTELSVDLFGDVYNVTIKEVSKKAVDCTVAYIPYIGPALVMAKDLNELVKSLYDACTDTEDKSYAANMVINCERLLDVLQEVSASFSSQLKNPKESKCSEYDNAVCFDLTVNMYKQIALIGCDFAGIYTGDESDFQNDRIQISSIKCHDNEWDKSIVVDLSGFQKAAIMDYVGFKSKSYIGPETYQFLQINTDYSADFKVATYSGSAQFFDEVKLKLKLSEDKKTYKDGNFEFLVQCDNDRVVLECIEAEEKSYIEVGDIFEFNRDASPEKIKMAYDKIINEYQKVFMISKDEYWEGEELIWEKYPLCQKNVLREYFRNGREVFAVYIDIDHDNSDELAIISRDGNWDICCYLYAWDENEVVPVFLDKDMINEDWGPEEFMDINFWNDGIISLQSGDQDTYYFDGCRAFHDGSLYSMTDWDQWNMLLSNNSDKVLLTPPVSAKTKAYRMALNNIINERFFPDGSEATSYSDASYSDIYENSFCVYDIDGDGSDELIIKYNATFLAGMVETIYDYDESTEAMRCELKCFPSLEYYENKYVIEKDSHNQSNSDFWPYVLYKYDYSIDSYSSIAYVWAFDEEYDYEGDFPYNVDTDRNGRVYYINQGDDSTLGVSIVDDADYKKWLESFLDIDNVKEIKLEFQKMYHENINSLIAN